MQCIYAILNKVTGDRYIGSAKNFYNRKRRHLNLIRKNKHHSYLLQKAWNKFKEDNFSFIILEKVVTDTLLIEREQWWIDNSNSIYNICKIAQSSLGVKRTQETIEKIRKANLGLKHPEWRNQIKSKAQRGDNHWTKSKKFSTEAKQNMSNAQKILYKNGYKSPASRKIDQYTTNNEFIKTWESAANAQLELKISRFAIAQCLIGKNKTSGGFIWKYNNLKI